MRVRRFSAVFGSDSYILSQLKRITRRKKLLAILITAPKKKIAYLDDLESLSHATEPKAFQIVFVDKSATLNA